MLSPDVPTPTRMLMQLREKVERVVPDPWFFPQRGTVSGYYGTERLVIVGRRPTFSDFADTGANKLFYEILAEFGLNDAHLTNIIKSRGRKGEADPGNLDLHEELFEEELRHIGQPAVVAMGDAYRQVSDFLLKRGAKPVARIPQYASMNYGAENIERFRREMAVVAELARKSGWIR